NDSAGSHVDVVKTLLKEFCESFAHSNILYFRLHAVRLLSPNGVDFKFQCAFSLMSPLKPSVS
ncbi:MAG: hypothetical protein ACPHKJ_05490, partial [Litorivicinaceae bacterium]